MKRNLALLLTIWYSDPPNQSVEARIVSDLEKKAISFVLILQTRQLLVSVLRHGAELQH